MEPRPSRDGATPLLPSVLCFPVPTGTKPKPGELDLVKLLGFTYPEPLFSLSRISMHADFPRVSCKSQASFYLRAFALAAPVPGCPYRQV